MKQESWRTVTPHYDHFDAVLAQFSTLPQVSFLDIQTRLKQTLNTFCKLEHYRCLVLNAPDNAHYRSLLKQSLHKIDESKQVLCSESIDASSLLGHYSCNESGDVVTKITGQLQQATDDGIVIISANLLLAHPVHWPAIKSAIMGEYYPLINSNPARPANQAPTAVAQAKLIVLGDQHQLAELEYLEPELFSRLSMYSEVELDVALNEASIERYLGYLSWLSTQYQLPSLEVDAVKRVMVAGARHTEDQSFMPLDVSWYQSIIKEALLFSNSDVITANDIESAIDAKYQRESYLCERALSDITEGQVVIETQGECVGQVNGLTVIDVPGHPLSYGEPARISCVIHFGDGDISDVERKAELGGNLHAKGMMIMQAFVSSALNLDEPLPYSASVVFEQSYSEVDGDSATLAELCSFVSALSEYPINQQIAVTGAVDQFGRVQAVGGLNEKIEGFYHVCKHQGFTGHQGVILPKTNLKHLALHKDVIESIKNNEFHIWSVSTVDEAIPLIMGKPFRGDDESSVISKIAERIESFERHDQPLSLMDKIKSWLS